MPYVWQNRHYAAADAVLTVLREPTAEMLEAGRVQDEVLDNGHLAIWHAMIDAAQ